MLTIAPAGADVSAVQTMWKEYWQEFGLAGHFQGFDEECRRLPGAYGPPGGALAIALMDGAPAGTVALRPLRDRACEVKRLYVRPPFRGRGIGPALIEWAIEHAKALGYATMHGDTLPAMAEALRMYARLGFRVVGPYTGDPTPGAIYLELTL